MGKYNIHSGAKILDFSCGIGNHSIPLFKKGFRVVGYDPSPSYLRLAAARASKLEDGHEKRLKFIKGDPYSSSNTLKKNKEDNFDAVILMDNSFGYLDESRDRDMLKNLLKISKKNCILILETENRDWRLQNFEPVTSFESDNVQIYGRWKFNFASSVSEGLIKFYSRSSAQDHNMSLSLSLPMLMRLYSIHELISLLKKAGWTYKESYDDIVSLRPFSNSEISTFSISSAR